MPQIMDIIKVIAGCRVVTVQKTVEVPQFEFSLVTVVDVPVVQIVGLGAPVVEQIVWCWCHRSWRKSWCFFLGSSFGQGC